MKVGRDSEKQWKNRCRSQTDVGVWVKRGVSCEMMK